MREDQIYNYEKVIKCGGDHLAERMKAKERGALANSEGRDFELVFAVYRIVEIGAEIFADRTRLDQQDGSDVTEFVPCLVDDLRTRTREGITYYQLKNGRVRKKGLYEDFRDQKTLDELHDWVCSYHLVVDTTSRSRAAKRWIHERGLQVECYEFQASKHYMKMAQMHPSLRDWMYILTGSRSSNVLSTCYELMIARWLQEGDCNVQQFFRSLALDKRHFFPRIFGEAITEYEVFAANMEDFGIRCQLKDRTLHLMMNDAFFMQVDYCTDAYFYRYNRWHASHKELNQQKIITKLNTEGQLC